MISVRPAAMTDGAAIAAVQVATWRDVYAGIVPQAYLDGLSEARSAAGWERAIADGRRTVVVAQGDGAVVGFACGGVPARDHAAAADSELDAIYVLPSRQRRGTGRRLVAAVAAAASSTGARSMVVWVLTANRSGRGFYERLGAAEVAGLARGIDFGWGSEIEEIAYRWDDLTGLLE